jgi:hypothetical protein
VSRALGPKDTLRWGAPVMQPERRRPPEGASEDPHAVRAVDPARTPRMSATAGPGSSDAPPETEIARMIASGVHPKVARSLRYRQAREPEDPDPDLTERPLVGLDRPSQPAGPMPIRATSDGGHYGRYSGQASPVAAREAKPEPPSGVLAGEVPADARRDTRTVLMRRPKERWFSWILRGLRRRPS